MQHVELIDPKELKPHPERGLFRTVPDINSGTYLRIRESIEQRGIEHPIKVQSGTNVIIAGHTRTEIATELGLGQVPVVFLDLDDVAARSMMIRDNFERSLDEGDLIKLARVLKEWQEELGFEHGGDRSNGTGCRLKTVSEIAEMFDMGERQFRKYIKLLDLIEPLQDIVSRKLMGVKAGSLIAALDESRQHAFYVSIRPNLSTPGYTVSEALAKSYRENCDPTNDGEKDRLLNNDWADELNSEVELPDSEQGQDLPSQEIAVTDIRSAAAETSQARKTEVVFGEIDAKYQVKAQLQPNPPDRKKTAEIMRTGQAFTDPGERASFYKRAAKSKLEQLEKSLLRDESEIVSVLTPTVVGSEDEEIDGSLQRIALILERFQAKVDSIAGKETRV